MPASRDLRVILDADDRRLRAGLARSSTAFGQFETAGRRSMQGLSTAAKATAIGVAGLGAALGTKVVRDGIRFNAQMESNRMALKRFLGSGQEAEKFLNRLFETAKRTPFEFTDLTTASRRLLAFGLSAEKTQRILAATGDAIAAMGGGAENIDRVTLALGQMQAKGKVSGEELLQLTEAGIPAYQILKEELKLTGDQIANIGNEGIKAGPAIDALASGMEERFRGAAAEQAKTWDGMVSTMKDSWAQTTGAMTEGLFQEGKKWVPEVTRALSRVGAVFERKDLSLGEKVARSFAITGPMRDRIGRQFERADIPELVGDAIRGGLPVVAGAFADVAPKAASAFWDAFKEMGLGGQVLTGVVVSRTLFGGRGGRGGTFAMAGTAAGASFAGSFLGSVRGLLTEKLGERLSMRGGAAGALGRFLSTRGSSPGNPLFVADVTGGRAGKPGTPGVPVPGPGGTGGRPSFVSRLVRGVGWVAVPIGATQLVSDLAGNPQAGNVTRQGLAVTPGKTPGRVAGGDSFTAQRREQERWAADARRRTQEVSDAYERTGQIQTRVLGQSARRLSELRMHTARETGRIRDRLGEDTRRGREALAKNFEAAVRNVRRSMREGTVATAAGTREIERLMLLALQNMGFTREQALSVRRGQDPYSGKAIGGTQNLTGRQRGGFIPGSGTGDIVPAMLEPGEVVINRRAVQAFGGPQILDALNQMIPRFQGGGIVRLGRQLQRQGYQVGEHPAFGGVTPGVHSPNSYHYRGMALDVNADGRQGGEAAWLDRLYRRLQNVPGVLELLWRVKDHFNHLHVAMSGDGGPLGRFAAAPRIPRVRVGGPDSPLRALVQGTLDNARGAAQARVRRASRRTAAGGHPSMTAGGNASNIKLGQRLAARWGWGAGAQWAALRELWMRESGWNNWARNPSSGAFGIPQALPPSKMGAAAVAGDPVAQIRWGLGYIRGRYGSPTAALGFHDANNWYQRGGIVGLHRGGTVKRVATVGRPRRSPFSGPGWGFRRPSTLPPATTPGLRAVPPPGTLMERLEARFAMAELTEGLADDIEWAEALEREATRRYDRAVRSGDPRRVVEAASVLGGWRSTLGGLRETSLGSGDATAVDLAGEIRALRESIDRQTRFAESVAGIGQATALKAFSDVISGQIGVVAGQRGRAAGDGVTGYRL